MTKEQAFNLWITERSNSLSIKEEDDVGYDSAFYAGWAAALEYEGKVLYIKGLDPVEK